MRRFLTVSLGVGVLLFLLWPCMSSADELVLADGGKSDYVIVVGTDASPSEKYAAEELQRFLKEISGAELKIVTDDVEPQPKEIILGKNKHLERLGVKIDFEKLGKEGFTIRTVGSHLVIAGGRLRGTMYGVYTFLEDRLGCRWFTYDCSRIPKMDRIALGNIDDTQVPVLEYREPFGFKAFDGDWAARNKCNGNRARLEEKHGGQIKYYMFVHSFNRMIPPEKYFDEHPEYFSLVNGKRQRIRGQLCLTNPDVLRLGIECVKKWMREHPEATVFSVSQNDWHGWCECEKCQAIALREKRELPATEAAKKSKRKKPEGAEIGPVLEYVNKIADAVRDEFPDKIIDTLSYSYTQEPPKTIRPRPNVVVRLCSIRCCFAHPLATCDYEQNQKFRQDIKGWAEMCNRLWVWDYVTCFGHYIVPFPNLYSLKPNIQFFVKHNVKGIFEQGNYHSPGGYFSELRHWMLAKLLWNPELDDRKLMADFLDGYYGKAAPVIQQYIDLLHDKMRNENIHMTIGANPNSKFLTDDILDKSDAFIAEAEKLVADSPEDLKHVRACRIPLDYVRICRYLREHRAKPGASASYRIEGGRYTSGSDDEFLPLVQRFTKICEENKVTHVGEGGRRLYKFFKERILDRALGYKVVSIKNDALKFDVTPGMEGRIIGVTLLGRNRNLSYVAKPTAARYPAAGGYGEWRGKPNLWRIPRLRYAVKPGKDVTTLRMWPQWQYIIYNNRTITLPKGNAKRFTLRTDLVNKSPSPTGRQIGSEHYLNLGSPDDITVSFASGKPSIRLALPRDRIAGKVDIAPSDVKEGITLANHAEKIGLKWRIPQGEIESVTIRTNTRGPYVALSFQTPGGNLESNGRIEDIVQEYEILDDVSAIAQAPAPPGTAPGSRHYAGEVVGEQDTFSLYKRGTHSEIVADPTAVDGKCVSMGGFHHEWATQWRWNADSFDPGEEYDVFAIMKVRKKGDEGLAFTAGVYDAVNKKGIGSIRRAASEVEHDKWMKVKLATCIPKNGMYVWAAPPKNPDNVAEVRVDRFVAVRKNPPTEQ
ncbi:MAG: DUF4838 domain-containing protein [Planctomycetes bacterium]|nr:DUF4838 domain-containing protein [Planctomycetota bacterium]